MRMMTAGGEGAHLLSMASLVYRRLDGATMPPRASHRLKDIVRC